MKQIFSFFIVLTWVSAAWGAPIEKLETDKPLVEYLGESHDSKAIKQLMKSLRKKSGKFEEKELSKSIRYMAGDHVELEFAKEGKKTRLVKIEWEPEWEVAVTKDLKAPELKTSDDAMNFFNDGEYGYNTHIRSNEFSGGLEYFFYAGILKPGVVFYKSNNHHKLGVKQLRTSNEPKSPVEESIENSTKEQTFARTFGADAKPLFPVVRVGENGFKYVRKSDKGNRHILEGQTAAGEKLLYDGEMVGNDANGAGYMEVTKGDYTYRLYSKHFDQGYVNGIGGWNYYEKGNINKALGSIDGHFVYNFPVSVFHFSDKRLGIRGYFNVEEHPDANFDTHGPLVNFKINKSDKEYKTEYTGTGYAFPYLLHGEGRFKRTKGVHGSSQKCTINMGVPSCTGSNASGFPTKL